MEPQSGLYWVPIVWFSAAKIGRTNLPWGIRFFLNFTRKRCPCQFSISRQEAPGGVCPQRRGWCGRTAACSVDRRLPYTEFKFLRRSHLQEPCQRNRYSGNRVEKPSESPVNTHTWEPACKKQWNKSSYRANTRTWEPALDGPIAIPAKNNAIPFTLPNFF